ncbi:MAG: TonB-dependent receptor [Acidobacteria bacterium]|nr:TonB-dependent receptor [Acidobacteriota bacterium]
MNAALPFFCLLALMQAQPSQEKTTPVIQPIRESVLVIAPVFQPGIEIKSDEIYRRTLFSRDDQLLETLNSGINAGQHEGGGKSVEIRRYGFNMDHGGINGGLKVLVDNVQQNQGTQGHGQGYLGALKTLTPELVEEVEIIDGPFSAEYGDFSGLGVVHIRLKEALADQGTVRIQRSSFDSYRTFLGYSPALSRGNAFLAYEGSRTDGPFLNPLGYKRDNVTGSYTRRLDAARAIGFKFNFGRNEFSSSGQIPLDLVSSGALDRFGAIDPTNGGKIRMGTVGVYYRKELQSGATLKADGFLSRSLFDLFNNFTLFLNDASRGDAFQQHDSRYQEGLNAQFVRPYRLFGNSALLATGTNFHDNQIHVGLFPVERRVPFGVNTRAFAHVTNGAGYAQNGIDLLQNRLHLEAGLRWDYFRFKIGNEVSDAKLQPKFAIAYTPSHRFPLTASFNYGRGINTQDARGIMQRPESPKIATTDFYQTGIAYQLRRVSVASTLFLIDRSNEQVYVPDDGSFELKDPSRSYGYELKSSIHFTPYLKLNAGLTQVMNSFFKRMSPRLYVDSAPHRVANAALTLSPWRGIYSSLRWRHVGNYRLDGLNGSIRASGHDVLDLAVTKSLWPWVDFNVEIDNLANKAYYETQNFFESRVSPNAPAIERIHGTPGYPFGVTAGFTFRIGQK